MSRLSAFFLVLGITALTACGGGNNGSGSAGPLDPPPVTRAFDMGFTTWPFDATVANQRTYLA